MLVVLLFVKQFLKIQIKKQLSITPIKPLLTSSPIFQPLLYAYVNSRTPVYVCVCICIYIHIVCRFDFLTKWDHAIHTVLESAFLP